MQPERGEGLGEKGRLRLLGGLWVFVLVTVVFFRAVALPFAAAALIAYLAAPLVNRITRLRLGEWTPPRWVAILTIYLFFFVALYLLLLALIPQLYRELARITRETIDLANSLTPQRIQEITDRVETWFEGVGIPIDLSSHPGEPVQGPLNVTLDVSEVIASSAQKISSMLQENLGDILTVSRKVVTGVLAWIFMLFFVLMVAAFLSIDVGVVRAYFKSLVPQAYTEDVRALVDRIDRSLSGVVRGQATICLVNGLLTFAGLMLFKVKFAFLLATLATFFSLIPIFGTIISSVPIVLIGLSQDWKKGLAILLWIIGIHALEAYVLNPKIMGTAARIHPIVVAFALIAGERQYGLLGALFAVPIAAIVVACFDFARLKAQAPPTTPKVL